MFSFLEIADGEMVDMNAYLADYSHPYKLIRRLSWASTPLHRKDRTLPPSSDQLNRSTSRDQVYVIANSLYSTHYVVENTLCSTHYIIENTLYFTRYVVENTL